MAMDRRISMGKATRVIRGLPGLLIGRTDKQQDPILPPLGQRVARWLFWGSLPVVILFLVITFIDSLGTALSVLTQAESPYCINGASPCKGGGPGADLLSIGGWVIVPLLIGTLAAVVFDYRRSKKYVEDDKLVPTIEQVWQNLPKAPPSPEKDPQPRGNS
jgi:hypothetical protein